MVFSCGFSRLVSVGGTVMDLETPSVIHRARPSFVTHSTRLSGALGQSATRMVGYARHAGQMPVDGEGGVADKVPNLRHVKGSHSWDSPCSVVPLNLTERFRPH